MRRPHITNLRKTLQSVTRFVDEPFEMPKKMAKRFGARLRRRFRYLDYALDTPLKREAIDRLFYSFEHLPPTGKEYWFLLFTADEPKKARQLFSAFGRANSYGFQTNGVEVRNSPTNGGKGGIQGAFFFDKGVHTIPTEETTILLNGNEVATTGKVRAEITGSFPRYRYRLMDGDVVVADFETSKHAERKKPICVSYFRGPIGYGGFNIFFNYKGTLNGRQVTGTCHFQKVVAVGPFIPWRWARIAFKNGSDLEYWCIRTPTPGYQYKLALSATFYDAVTKKEHTFKDVKINNFGKNLDYWLVEARNKETEIVGLFKGYGRETFVFSLGSSFEYAPNFAEVKSFTMEGKLNYTQRELGTGVGIVEETKGIVL